MTLKDEVIAEMIARYGITQREAERRWNLFKSIDDLAMMVSLRRKGK